MLLGLTVMAAVAALMYQGVADGLVRNKISAAQNAALNETSQVQEAFNATDKTDMTTLYNVAVDSVKGITSSSADSSSIVVLMRARGNPSPGIPVVSAGQAKTLTPPMDLQRALAADPTHQQTKIMNVRQGDHTLPAVIVGSRVQVPNAGSYDLYLVFPMTKETQALSVVRNSFIGGGLALVLLLGACAYLATRLVVMPVRDAALVAEKLADGDLDERMPVKGEDDIAQLATTFNAMAASIQVQIAQLEDLSRLQQRFTSDVSHELRTPLTTIRMAADILYDSRGDFTAPVARSTELLSKELDRFEGLLGDLLEISRFDAGAAVLETAPLAMRPLCEDVVEMYAQLAENAGCSVTVDAPSDVEIPADRRRIERIVRNLVSNAIEHSNGKPVVVTLRSNLTAVSVSVRDYGVGLKEGEADKVFDRFWRADPARARTTGGTGLGLAISLEDAHLHHGWLEAWGALEEGSCFRLTLPRQEGVSISASPGPLHPANVRAPKLLAAPGTRSSDGGVRLIAGLPFALEGKDGRNTWPVLEGEARVVRVQDDER